MWDDLSKPTGRPTNVYAKARKDGKYSVTLCFAARKLRKIFTAEQLAEYQNDDSYNVIV